MSTDIPPITFTLSQTYEWDEGHREEMEEIYGEDWIAEDFYELMEGYFDNYVHSAVESDNVRIWAKNNRKRFL